ncbi:MAG: putative Ig domain-containing protein [Desulfococcaceae bacterium]
MRSSGSTFLGLFAILLVLFPLVAGATITSPLLPVSDENDFAGTAVAVEGDFAAVGAPSAGEEDDGGRTFVYQYDSANARWNFHLELGGSLGLSGGDQFGSAVAISGSSTGTYYLIVGSPGNDEAAGEAGAAYIYNLTANAWVADSGGAIAMLPRDDSQSSGDQFGTSVDIVSNSSGTYAVVGAPKDDVTGLDSGSVYFYRVEGSTWTYEGAKKSPAASGGGHEYGRSVAITSTSGTFRAMAGGPGHGSGRVAVFRRSGADAWTEDASIVSGDAASGDLFGVSVSMSGNYAVVGASLDDDLDGSSGSAYVFNWDGASWVQQDKQSASDGAANDRFGRSVSISGTLAIVGAPQHGDSGAAYLFERNGSVWTEIDKLEDIAAPADSRFGASVGVFQDAEGSKAIIGAPKYGSGRAYMDDSPENPDDSNFAPTISTIEDVFFTARQTPQTQTVNFSVGDVETDPADLIVSATWVATEGDIVTGGSLTPGGAGAGRTLDITPATGNQGEARVTVTVADEAGASSATTFMVDVSDPPRITGLQDQYVINIGETAEATFQVADNQDPASSLVVEAVSDNPALIDNLAVGGTSTDRTIDLVPQAAQSGSATITATVTDTDGHSASESFLFIVNAGPVFVSVTPDPVQFMEDPSPSPTVTVTLRDEFGGDVTLTAMSENESIVANPLTDPDDPDRTYFHAETKSATANQNISFTFQIDPVEHANGTATVLLEAIGPTEAKSTRSLTLEIEPADDPPVIEDIVLDEISIIDDEVEIPENGKTGNIRILLSHPDATVEAPKTVSLSVDSLNGFLIGSIRLDGNEVDEKTVSIGAGQTATVNLVISAADGALGTDTVTVTADDGNLSSQEQFDLTVFEVNDPPTISEISDQTTPEDTPINNIPFTVGDEETPPGELIVTVVSDNPDLIPDDPDHLKLGGSGADRTLTIIPFPNANSDDFGPAVVTLTVTDAGAGNDPPKSANRSFLVTVDSVNDPATARGLDSFYTTPEKTSLTTAPITVCDVDGGRITLRLSSQTPSIFPDDDQHLQIRHGDLTVGRQYVVDPLFDAEQDGLPSRCDDPEKELAFIFTPLGNANGTADLTLTITDDQGLETVRNFSVFVQFVNDPPAIEGNPPTVAYVNQPYEFTPVVEDEEDALSQLRFERVCMNVDPTSDNLTTDGCPAWLQFDSNTGALSGIPPNEEADTSITGLRITVIDTGDLFDSITFDMQVLKDPQPPELSDIANKTTPEDQAIDVPFTASDPNGDPIVFTLESGNTKLVDPATRPHTDPGGMLITGPDVGVDDMGRFTLTPPDANPVSLNLRVTPRADANNLRDGGPTTLSITATDPDGETGFQSFVLDVTPVPDDPTLENIDFNQEESINENAEFRFSDVRPEGFVAGDADGGILLVSATSGNQTLLPDANLRVFPLGESPGFNNDYQIQLSEADGYKAAMDLIATPAANRSGQAVITVSVTDENEATTSRQFLLHVVNENNDPEILSITPPASMTEGERIAVPFTIRDFDDDTLTLAATADPADRFSDIRFSGTGVTLDGSGNYAVPVEAGVETSVNLDLTGAPGQFGSTTVTLTVRDVAATADPPATRTFTIDVTNVNDPPTISSISNVTVDEDTGPHAVAFTIDDPDLNNLTVSAESLNPEIVATSDIELLVNGSPLTLPQSIPSESYDQLELNIDTLQHAFGNAVIEVAVDDGTAEPATTSFTLIVKPTPDPPVLTPVGDVTMNEDDEAPSPNPIPVIVRDPDGGTLTLLIRSEDTAGAVLPNRTDNISVGGPTGVVTEVIQSLDELDREVVKVTMELEPNVETPLDLTLKPEPDAFTEPDFVTVHLTLQDAETTDDSADSFNVTVLGVNDPPSVSDIVGPKFTTASTATDPIPFLISDPETAVESLILDIVSSNQDVVPDDNIEVFTSTQTGFNREMVITPLNSVGETTIAVTVVDASGQTDTTNFVLKVRSGDVRQPDIDPIDLKAMDEDTSLTFTLDVTFPLESGEAVADVLEVRASSGDIDLIPNGPPYIQVQYVESSGSVHSYDLTLMPADDKPISTETVETTITVLAITLLPDSFTAEEIFTLRVDPLPDAPELLDIPEIQQSTFENVPYTLNFRVKDADGDPLTVSAVSNNQTLFPNDSLVIEGLSGGGVVTPEPPGSASLKLTATPAANRKNDSAIITISVDDGTTSPVVSGQFTLRVNESGCPIISQISRQLTNIDGPITGIPFSITDTEGGLLTVSATSSNTGLIQNTGIQINTLNSDGTLFSEPGTPIDLTLNLTPRSGQSGESVIEIAAVDESGKSCPMSFLFEVRAVRPGDINASGAVNLTDVVLGLQVLAGLDPANVDNRADLTNPDEGVIGLEEVIYDLQVVAEIR